jgi:nucleoside-diphosphate-sugar epimerase
VLKSPNQIVNGQIFNAGGDTNNFTKKMIVEIILKYIPHAKVRYQEHGSDPRNYRVNFKKVRDILDFEPTIGVEDGIKELIACLENHCFDAALKDKIGYGNYHIY